jgi:prevent-host-death family protein
MPKRYSIAEARHNLAAIVHELEHQPLVELTRRGEPVAVLLALEEYRRLKRQSGDFWSAYMAFSADQLAAEAVESEPFADVRDRSPGRAIDL